MSQGILFYFKKGMIKIEKEKVCICYRCKNKVWPSMSLEYEYQCFIHDEDLYGIETITIDRSEYIKKLSRKLHCSIEQADKLEREYDKYVNICILNEEYPISIKQFHKIQRSREVEKERSM